MAGFFTKHQTKLVERPDGKHLSCLACGLYKNCTTPKMKPYGNFKKGIMCIGDMPGEQEDATGMMWQGRSGLLLRKTLKSFDIDLVEDCVSINTVNCRPISKEGKTRPPTPFEMDCCKRSLYSTIAQYKPKMILLFGNVPVQVIIGDRWKKDLGKLQKWVGFTIPDQDLQTWLCPVFHPTYVSHEDKQEVYNQWEKDLDNAFCVLNKPFPIFKQPTIHYLEESELPKLNSITGGCVAIDYETTGLKPHKKGHEIMCTSIAISCDEVYVFQKPQKRKYLLPFINILENEKIGKIAQNMKYEHTWSFYCLGVNVVNWVWDTMLATHILDNRSDITGLKFQTYVNFGVADYSSEIEPILQGEDPKDSNSTNKLKEYMKSKENALKVMKYCAWDSVFTYRLALIQQKQLEEC